MPKNKSGRASVTMEVPRLNNVQASSYVTPTSTSNFEDEVKTFTGAKLDTLSLACADYATQSFDFRVLFAIVKHLNAKNRVAWVSDETIADEVAGSRRNVIRARERLRRAGWLGWRRTRGVNVYWLMKIRENELLDNLIHYKELRQARREQGRNVRRRMPPVSQQKSPHVPVRSLQGAPTESLQAVSAPSPKHLAFNTSSQTTISEGPHPGTVIVEGLHSMPDIPAFLDRRVRR